jgi:glycerol transport system ATP-binding protein
MRSGRIVQAGPPNALFDDPVDRFAAFFIGSPGMNFLDLALSADGFHVAADPTLRVATPASLLEASRARGSNRVVLGIRPHMVELASGVVDNVLPATLLDTSLIGRELQADFMLAGQTIKTVLPAQTNVQDSRALRFPPEHCFFFGPDGARLG